MEMILTGIWERNDKEGSKLTFFDLGGDCYRILNFDKKKNDMDIIVAGFQKSLRVDPNVFESDILFIDEDAIQIKGVLYHRLTKRSLSNEF